MTDTNEVSAFVSHCTSVAWLEHHLAHVATRLNELGRKTAVPPPSPPPPEDAVQKDAEPYRRAEGEGGERKWR